MVLTSEPRIAGKESSFWAKAWSNPWVVSLLEVFFTLLVSNFAILIAAFVYLLGQSEPQETAFWSVFFAVISKNIKSTEIIVFILGLIAPAMWIMFKHIRLWRHTVLWVVLLAIQAVVVVSTAIIFAMSITDTLKNRDLANFWAYWCFGAAICVWYSTLVYQKKVIESAADIVERPKPGRESGSDVLAALRGQ